MGIIILVISIFIAYLAFRYKVGRIPHILTWIDKDTIQSIKEKSREEPDHADKLYMKLVDEEHKKSVDKVCKETVDNVYKKLAEETLKAVVHNNHKNQGKEHLIFITWILMITGLVMVVIFGLTYIIM